MTDDALSDDADFGKRISRANYVYFVRAQVLGLIKIGIAKDVNARLHGLQTGSPDKLHLMGVIRPREEDPAFVEMRLHTKFRRHRSHGEWFHPVDPLLQYIEAHAVSMDVDRQQLIYEAMDRIGATMDPAKRDARYIKAEHARQDRAAELYAQNLKPAQIVALTDRPRIPEGVDVPKGTGREARMKRYLLARGLSR